MRWIGGIVIVAGAASALAAGPGHVDLYPVALLDVVAAVLGLACLPASAFLRVFLVLFWSEAALFSLASVAAATGRWPVALAALTVPASLPISADVFCLLVLALARVPVIRRTTAIGDLYLASASPVRIPLPPWRPMAIAEGRLAAATIAFLVCLRQSELLVGILATFATRSFFDAMQALDGPAFWHQLLVVIPSLALARTGLGLIDLATGATLSICWRRWLTGYYVERWLGDHRHYRLALAGTGGDNPDQRIADDVHRFQAELYDLSVGLVMSLTSLVSYAILLLTLSAGVAIPGTGIVVPGLLLWCAVICAAAGSLITHLVGRPLSRLSFQSQRCEADFRFSLARLREHGEQVALAGGEAREIRDLDRGFAGIVDVFYRSLYVRMRLIFSEALIGRVSYIVPYAVMAPAFLMRRIKLGVLQQTAQAFAAVSAALGFFITRYQALADFSAVLGRLEGFGADLAGVRVAPDGDDGRRRARRRPPAARLRHRPSVRGDARRTVRPLAAARGADHSDRALRRRQIHLAAGHGRRLALYVRRRGTAARRQAADPDRGGILARRHAARRS